MAMNCLVFRGHEISLNASAKMTKLQPRLCTTELIASRIAVMPLTIGSRNAFVAKMKCKSYLSAQPGRDRNRRDARGDNARSALPRAYLRAKRHVLRAPARHSPNRSDRSGRPAEETARRGACRRAAERRAARGSCERASQFGMEFGI